MGGAWEADPGVGAGGCGGVAVPKGWPAVLRRVGRLEVDRPIRRVALRLTPTQGVPQSRNRRTRCLHICSHQRLMASR